MGTDVTAVTATAEETETATAATTEEVAEEEVTTTEVAVEVGEAETVTAAATMVIAAMVTAKDTATTRRATEGEIATRLRRDPAEATVGRTMEGATMEVEETDVR